MVNITMEGLSRSNLHSELVTLYQDLEKELMALNPGCDRCGTCCNFRTFDHVLYASSIEVDFITQHVEVPDFDVTNNRCPFLKDNQCSIRTFRALGCRIFYCDPDYQAISHDLYEKYHRIIKKISKKYNVQWKYLPFLTQLSEFKSRLSPLIGNPKSPLD